MFLLFALVGVVFAASQNHNYAINGQTYNILGSTSYVSQVGASTQGSPVGGPPPLTLMNFSYERGYGYLEVAQLVLR